MIILLGMYYVVNFREESDFIVEQQAEYIDNTSTTIENDGLKFTALNGDIVNIIADNKENYSVFIAQPTVSNEQLIINNEVRRSASMIKVFIMACVMDQAAHNILNLDSTVMLEESNKVGGSGIIGSWRNGTRISIAELTKLMIAESDNTATNILIDYLGMDNINSYIRLNGYNETVLQRKMMDWNAVKNGRENYSSVKDIGRFFCKLVNKSCVNEEYDQKMIDILLQQTDAEVFPAAVQNVAIAHKTGELDNLYDDGGIVFNAGDPYVIVVMNDGVSRGTAISIMKKIFVTVYEYLKTNSAP